MDFVCAPQVPRPRHFINCGNSSAFRGRRPVAACSEIGGSADEVRRFASGRQHLRRRHAEAILGFSQILGEFSFDNSFHVGIRIDNLRRIAAGTGDMVPIHANSPKLR